MYVIKPESMFYDVSIALYFEDEPTIVNCSDFTKQHQSKKSNLLNVGKLYQLT